MIAVSLAHIRQFSAALRSGADLVELRNDVISNTALERLIQRSTLPVILALKRPIADDQVQRLVRSKRVRYVDIDYRQSRLVQTVKLVRHSSTKMIISAHDYRTTPPWAEIERLVHHIQQLKPDVIKIAALIRRVDDLIVIKRLQEKFGRRIIAIGMGELGLMTRIYNRGLLTYAAVHEGKGTAPGQLTVQQLRNMQLYGLIGDDIQESLSPALHNVAFRKQHLPHRYQLWQTQNLEAFMDVFEFFRLPGASVTKPYKKDIIKYCTQLDHHARAIGAVNTLVRRGRKLNGYNTDWIGVQRALAGKLRAKRVLILGSGGAAAACAYAAQQARAQQVTCLSHTQLPTARTDFDVIINATPVTQHLLVPPTALKNKIVMDCIYGRSTALLRAARRQHAQPVTDGLAMLRYQATEQFKLWTGKSFVL